ncbi:MAG: acetoin utilization protein AcuC [Desulfobacteraceae bacterium 4572_35.1]|nr:MAG: acetoin utilization protein AcuC [Desulfobacteraceae bacterium 4572_35.1]
MSETFALIYSSRFGEYSYGDFHPFKVDRYRLTYELMEQSGLVDLPQVKVVECPFVSEDMLLDFHRLDYLDTLKKFSMDDEPHANFFYGLGDVENPVFKGLYDWSRLMCGGTIEAVRQVTEHGCRAAFSMAGGWHHAHAARASGFSYLNDLVVAIKQLLKQGKRVVYVDIDAHHGDGVQEAFYSTDQVLTISIHENGKDFYPYSGFVDEVGSGDGYGYSVNIPLVSHSDDLIFEQAFQRVILPLIEGFAPDVLVTQMGADPLRTDPLTRLECTTAFMEYAGRQFLATDIPWVAIGGGGYDRLNVARTWTLLWATMIGEYVDDEFTSSLQATIAEIDEECFWLRDLPHMAAPDDFARAQQALDKNLSFIERCIFPLFNLSV